MRFIYVVDEESAKELLLKGFIPLKEDTQNRVWIFENKDTATFELDVGFPCVFSDVMTF